ncbi:hypothetical protein BC2230_60129 [Burkholderia cepacia]
MKVLLFTARRSAPGKAFLPAPGAPNARAGDAGFGTAREGSYPQPGGLRHEWIIVNDQG